MQMKFTITGAASIDVVHDTLTGLTNMKESRVYLDVDGKDIDTAQYFTNDSPNEAGGECMVNAFVQGLIVCIKVAHAKGYKNESDTMRFIIAELERGFVNTKLFIK